MWHLGMSHDEWFGLPAWQRSEWLAYERRMNDDIGKYVDAHKQVNERTGEQELPMLFAPAAPILRAIGRWL